MVPNYWYSMRVAECILTIAHSSPNVTIYGQRDTIIILSCLSLIQDVVVDKLIKHGHEYKSKKGHLQYYYINTFIADKKGKWCSFL